MVHRQERRSGRRHADHRAADPSGQPDFRGVDHAGAEPAGAPGIAGKVQGGRAFQRGRSGRARNSPSRRAGAWARRGLGPAGSWPGGVLARRGLGPAGVWARPGSWPSGVWARDRTRRSAGPGRDMRGNRGTVAATRRPAALMPWTRHAGHWPNSRDGRPAVGRTRGTGRRPLAGLADTTRRRRPNSRDDTPTGRAEFLCRQHFRETGIRALAATCRGGLR